MQMEKLTERHEKYLKDVVGVAPDVFRQMTYEELDALVDEKLMWLECDGVDDSLPNGITDEGKLAADLINIIYGPYGEGD